MKQISFLPFSRSELLPAALLLLAMSLCCSVAQAQSTNAVPPGQGLGVVQDGPGAPNYVPNEILVKFKPGATDNEIADLVRRAAVTSAKHILTPAMHASGDIGITRLSTAVHVPQALEALRNHPAIEMAQPNWLYTHQAVPNDPYYEDGSLWGMYGDASAPSNAYGSQAAEAWAAGNIGWGTVCIGIIDEGVQYNHPDLAANMWVNPGETPGNGLDDDNNGYIDDIYGWNAVNDNGVIYDPSSDDHGTHVAGTIGAVGNNGFGVVGMNWNVRLIVGKFLGSSGGTTADAIQAIDYMTNLKKNKDVNIVALNNSWGGGGYDSLLLAAIQRAASENILFVAAAGNSRVNTDRRPYYPACYSLDSIISVAAIDRVGALASFSNYGAKTVDLGAPGVAILSTLPGGTYGAYDGTSMATPHVTGAAALYAAANPGASIATIKNAIMTSALATTSLAGKTVTGGRLNVSGFTGGPVPSGPPAAPSDLTAIAETDVCKITLTWTDNSDDETSFVIVQTCDGKDTYITVSPQDGKGSTVSYEDTWLQPNTVYGYKVAARNSYGTSAYSDLVSATTAAFEPSASASYLGTDTETKGNWCYTFGTSGYGHLPFGEPTYFFTPYSYPSDVTVECSDRSIFTWTEAYADTNARLWKDYSMTDRWLGCYYSSPSFTLDLDTGTTPYKVAFYVVDGWPYYRSQTIEIFDFDLQIPIEGPQTVTEFTGGKYLVYNIQGRVLVTFTCTGGGNGDAVLSGIFFDAPDTEDPHVFITIPSPDASVSGTVTISATASDDNAVAKVDFYVDGNLVGTDYTATDGFSVSWDSTKAAPGSHVLTAVATDTAHNATTSEGVAVKVEGVSVHCGDLDGTKAVTGRKWTATVTATIHNADHQPVSGAVVTGTWSGGYSGTTQPLTTGANGTVSFKTGSMDTTRTSVTFTISSVTGPNMTYSADNHDPDNDSNGTSIIITK